MGNSVYEIITEKVLEQLEKGTVLWRKPWKGGAGWPKNLESGRKYNGINVFLLMAQGYDSPYWLTFAGAKRMGGHVKKGERHTKVILWKPIKKKVENEDGEIEEKLSFLLRYFRVWNLEQCEGIEVPEEEPMPDFSPIEACEAVINGMPKRPAIFWKEQRAYYRPSTDVVNLPKKETFESTEEYYSTAFHELAHSTGHKSRLNRFGKEAANHIFGSDSYSKEELVAEMTAAFLCGKVGIDNATIENSAAYIDGWSKAFKERPKMVISAAAKAQHAAEFILDSKAGEDEEPKAA